jgi:hypothetical protein
VNTRRRIAAIAVGLIVLVAATAGSCDSAPSAPSAQSSGQAETETAFAQQRAAVPYPVAELKDSLERRNLRERLLRTNQPNKIGYVYLLSFAGQPLGYYVIKGKVSSTDSQMTATDMVVDGTRGSVTVPAPGDDGSYGKNEPGIFFFTSEGSMVTTNLNYLYSDAPLPLNVPKLNGK